MNQYSPYALSGAIYLMAKKMLSRCPVVSRIFPASRWVGNDAVNISWDVITGTSTIMRALRIFSPGQIGTQTTEQTITAQLPKFHEIRPVEAGGTLLLTREPGKRDRMGRRLLSKVEQEHMDLTQKFVRTVEYMAAQSLKGTIAMVNEKGDSFTVAEWSLPNKNKPAAYSGNDLWTADESDPAQNIIDLKVAIQESIKADVEKWFIFAGTKVATSVRKNKALKGDGRRLKLKDVAEELEVDEFVHYPDTFQGESGTWSPFVATNQFALVAYSPQFYSLQYLYLAELLALAAAAGNQMGEKKMKDSDIDKLICMSEAYMKRDPRIYQTTLEAYVLPVCHAPGSTAIVQPVEA